MRINYYPYVDIFLCYIFTHNQKLTKAAILIIGYSVFAGSVDGITFVMLK